jgi:hypothetical protein
MLLISGNERSLFPLGLGLWLVLVLQYSLYAIVEADNRLVVSIKLFGFVPDG